MFRCRKCFLRLVVVSKFGTFTPSSSSPPLAAAASLPLHTSHAFVVLVIALAVSVLVCLCTFIFLFRRGGGGGGGGEGDDYRTRPSSTEITAHEAIDTMGQVNGAPNCNKADLVGEGDDEDEGFGGKRRMKPVELVVMAGEATPTFLAHPASAAQDKGKLVECPPMQLFEVIDR